MDIICMQCGAKLPQANARYCNNCGVLVSSNPFSTLSSATKDGASSPVVNEQQYSSRPPLREQIAQQPPARPLQHSVSNEPPAWMNRLEPGTQSRTRPDPLRMKRTIEGTNEQRQESISDKPTQANLPATEPARDVAHRSVPPTAAARELHIKVWPQEEVPPADMPQSAAVPQTQAEEQSVDNTVEDLPTRPLAVSARHMPPVPPVPPVQRVATPLPASKREDGSAGDVEQLHTAPLAAQKSMAPIFPTNQSTAYSRQVEQWSGQSRGTVDSLSFPASHPSQPVTPPSRPIVQPQPQPARQYTQGSVSPVPLSIPMQGQGRMPSPLTPLPPVASAQERTQTPPVIPVRSGTAPFAPGTRGGRRAKRNRRVPLMLGLIALVVLVVGGLGVWVVVRQPFTVPASTMPQQTFTNAQLGMSVLYPSGWTTKVDQAKQTVYFSDSSHTGQVTIMVAAASATSGDVGQYLRGEATHLGMTAIKQGTPLSFAAASWQEIQGNVQQAGANYTAVLLATTHGGHIYTIMQMAPQPVYSQEDQLIFSAMRSSFHFLV